MPKRTTAFRDDLLVDLADPQEAAYYLNAALEDSEEMFLVALGDVADAKQMSKVAEAAGVARESIYRMLAPKGNPTYYNLLGILRAVGLKVAITPQGGINPKPYWEITKGAGATSGGMLQQKRGEAGKTREKAVYSASSMRKYVAVAGSMGFRPLPASASL